MSYNKEHESQQDEESCVEPLSLANGGLALGPQAQRFFLTVKHYAPTTLHTATHGILSGLGSDRAQHIGG